MGLLDRLESLWGMEPERLENYTSENPDLVKSEIGRLKELLNRGTEKQQIAAANAIAGGVTTRISLIENGDIFDTIIYNLNKDNDSIRQPLVLSLGKSVPIISGNQKRKLVTRATDIAELLEHVDEETIHWALPVVSIVSIEYPDPFIEHAEPIATGLESPNDTILTSAIESLATIAEQNSECVAPYTDRLLTQTEDGRPWQFAEATRTVALVAANDPTVVDTERYIERLKYAHDADSVPYKQAAVRSIGYLLSSNPDQFENETLLSRLKNSLSHESDHIKKDATIAYLRIVKNTDTEILDNPDTARTLKSSIKQFDLQKEITGIESIADEIEVATTPSN